MLSFGRKTNEILNKFFQTKNKKELRENFTKWSLIEQTKFEQLKKNKLNIELNKKNDLKEKPLSKRERTKINKELKQRQQLKEAELKKIEKEVLPEVKKIRIKKETVQREKALFIKDYQFKINDTRKILPPLTMVYLLLKQTFPKLNWLKKLQNNYA
jgi:DNA mismatch repair protein MutS2